MQPRRCASIILASGYVIAARRHRLQRLALAFLSPETTRGRGAEVRAGAVGSARSLGGREGRACAAGVLAGSTGRAGQ